MKLSHRAWARGALLVVAAAAAGSLLTGLLIWRAHVNASATARTHAVIVQVCARVHRLDMALEQLVSVGSSRKQLLKTLYYRQHPDEMARAEALARHNVRVLRKADCGPAELGQILAKGTR